MRDLAYHSGLRHALVRVRIAHRRGVATWRRRHLRRDLLTIQLLESERDCLESALDVADDTPNEGGDTMRLQPGADLTDDEAMQLLTMASIEPAYQHVCSVCDTLAHSDVPGQYRETRFRLSLILGRTILGYQEDVRTDGDVASIYLRLSRVFADLSSATEQLAVLPVLGEEAGAADITVEIGPEAYALNLDAASDDSALDGSSRIALLFLLASRHCGDQSHRAFAEANPDNIPF